MSGQEGNSQKCVILCGQEKCKRFSLGIPKGMKKILEACNINTDTLNADQMRQILSDHDFKNEKPRIIKFLKEKGYTALFLPKFHLELDPIERVWCQAKRYSKAHCNYSQGKH